MDLCRSEELRKLRLLFSHELRQYMAVQTSKVIHPRINKLNLGITFAFRHFSAPQCVSKSKVMLKGCRFANSMLSTALDVERVLAWMLSQAATLFFLASGVRI